MDAADWDERYAATELVWGAPANPTVVDQLWPLPAGRALDLACGEGRHAIWLAEHGWSVTAVDFSHMALDKAATVASRSARSVRARISWRCADVTTESYDDDYSLVLLAYLHLPAPQRRQMLDHAIAALTDFGTLVVLGHDTTNIKDGFGGPREPSILYTPADIVDDLDGRLEIAVAETRTRPTEGKPAIDALVVASNVPAQA